MDPDAPSNDPPVSRDPSGRVADLAVLDALRGLAALYVMLGHAFHFLIAQTVSTDPSSASGLVLQLGTGMFRWGHEAVLLFFLISGFCIHYRQARGLRTGMVRSSTLWSWFDVRAYGLRRFRRLFPPLALALAATAVFDAIGHRVNPDYYAGAYVTVTEHLQAPSYSITTFLGNLFFQASFAVPPFGMNGPLWSLAFEFWFYALYPLALVITWRWHVGWLLAIAAGASLTALVLMPSTLLGPGAELGAYQSGLVPWWVAVVFLYWSVWIWGAAIAEAYVGRFRLPRILGLLGIAIVAAGLLWLKLGWPSDRATPWRIHDLVIAGLFALALAYVMVVSPNWLRWPVERVAKRLALLGDMSYSLYVVHLPWLVLLSAAWLSIHATLPSGAELFIAGTVSALLLAFASWYFVERHFMTPRWARAQWPDGVSSRDLQAGPAAGIGPTLPLRPAADEP